MNVDLKEFRAAFVAEAEEHLADVRALLLAIERSIREGQSRGMQRELRELMRLLHTVKGLAAMVGVEPIVAVTHRMESVVRSAERTGATLTEGALESLIEGTRAIESRVHAVSEDRAVPPPPAELIAALESVEPAAPPRRPVGAKLDPAITSKLGPSELTQLEDGVRSGRRALRVDFAPSADKVNQGLSITTVRERLAAFAEIVKVIPTTIAATANAAGGLVFTLVVLTDVPDERVAEAVGVTPAEVHLLLGAETASEEVTATWTALPEEEEFRSDAGHGVLRVEVARVDDAIDMLGGLVVTRARMTRAVERMAASGVDTRELRALMNDDARQLRELRAAILRVRMIPMAAVLERLPLVVRGLGRASSKQVRIHLDVGTAELDKAVAERLFPAFVHIVRNAIDHGVESPAERLAAGKSDTATITISSSTVGRNVEIRIADDGRGVDRVAVAARAGQPVPASNAALLDLLCRPGLSTRDEADTTSGRGVGMDAVRKVVVHNLGGELSLDTERNGGTTFLLRVPLTVAIVDAFTVRCAGERFVVPVPVVDEIVELGDARLLAGPTNPLALRAGARKHAPPKLLSRRGKTIPLFDLADALELPVSEPPTHGLLVRTGTGELVGYAVDRVLGQQEIVVRPLADPLVARTAVSGSTDLGDGRATVVLDLLALSADLDARGRAA